MDGSPIGLLLVLTYGSSTPVIAPDATVYGTIKTGALLGTLEDALSSLTVNTDASPGTLKNPTISGNVSSRQGNQSTNSGSGSGTIRGTE